jgi:succinoglycan biosynthesis transport protein ExoP
MPNVVKPRASRPEFLPLSIARMLWKHKVLIATASILLASAACVIVYSLRPVYKAEAVVLVDSQKIPESFVASTVQVSLQDSLTTISQRVLSATRLQKIMTDFNLYREQRKRLTFEEVAEEMRKDLIVTPVQGWAGGRSAAFRVSYQGYSANTVAAVANQVAALFIGENVTTRAQRAENTTDFLETQLEQAKASLEQQEAHLSRFKLQHRGELPQQEAALLSTLSRFQSELQGTQDAANRAEQNRVLLQNSLNVAESSVANLTRSVHAASSTTSVVATANQTAQRVAASQSVRAKLQALEAHYSAEHPDVTRARSELAAALREEEAARSRLAQQQESKPVVTKVETSIPPPSQLVAELNTEKERAQMIRLQLNLLNKEIADRNAERQQILRNISTYQGKVERLPVREQEMTSVLRDYEMSKQNYSSLLAKKLSAEMAGQMEHRQQSERFTLLEPARVPSAPIKPKRLILCGVAAVGSLVLCVAFAIGLELRKNCLLGEWELPSEWTVIGRISKIEVPPPGGAPIGLESR